MKKELIFFFTLMLCISMMADPVSRKKALQTGQQFMKELRLQPTDDLQLVKQELRQTDGQADKAYYYVFNIKNDKGFVIVSGDDNTDEILGYSDSGHIDPNNIPTNMQAWLDGCVRQMKWLESNGIKTTAAARKAARKASTKSTIAPMLSTTWGQKTPYNLQTPMCPVNTEEHSVTGCVATAMAQVLYYTAMRNCKPSYTTTTEIPSYKYKVNGVESTVEAIASGTTIDYSKMKESYSTDDVSESAQAVAMLMRCCGQGVRMSYTSSSSSASSTPVPSTLTNYLGCDATTKLVDRVSYSAADWDALIYNELAEGRPVLYNGQSSGGGHAFAVDGYDGTLYHVNWGWNGRGDGHFALAVLNPYYNEGTGASTSKDGYSYGQDAIIGISMQGRVPTSEPLVLTSKNISSSVSSATRGSTSEDFSVQFSYSISNQTGSQQTFSYGIGLYDVEGNLVTNHNDNTSTFANGKGYDIETTFNFGNGLADGTYYICSISKLSSETEWSKSKGFKTHYVKAVIAGNTVTLSNSPFVSLYVSDMSVTGDKKAGNAQTLNFTITNNGTDFNGYLYILEDDTKKGGKIFELAAGATSTFSIEYFPLEEGTKTITLAYDEKGSNVIYTKPVDITEATTSDDVVMTPIASAEMSDDKIIYGTTQVVKLAFKNDTETDFKGTVGVKLYEKETGSSSYSCNTTTTTKTIPAKKTVNMSITFDLDASKLYKFSAYYVKSGTEVESNAGEFKNVVTDYYTSTDGNGNKTYAAATATVAAPAGATSLDLRNTSTVTTVTPSSNPNCVYLLNESASVPSGLSTNVVKGTTAESVTLTDGYDFSSPISFQATSISYTRTFTTGVGASSGGWSTIVLPFDVTSVTVGGEAKDWFHSSTDTGKHFWAKSFTSDGASTVYFGYATSLKANTPYIIAVPGEEWGSAWQLTGKAMTFTGSNCTITAGTAAQVAGASYKFAGGTSSQTVSGYMLNSAGTKFEMATGATLDAFRACFLSTTSSSLGSTLSIGSDDGTTGICLPGVELQQELRGPIYRLNGQRVSDDASTFDQLPHGVYIINGKKVIK